MSTSRRDFLLRSSAAAFLSRALATAPALASSVEQASAAPMRGLKSKVVTPNATNLPYRMSGEVKVFHLIAQEVEHEFAPGLRALCYGYNGQVHGPTIEAVEGDRLRIYVENRLGVPTTVHWHGLLIPNGMDGVGGLTQRPIQPGEIFRYEFTLRQHGTYMYHSHHDEMTQMALGLMGLFIIHPRESLGPQVDRDYAFLLSEWKLTPGLHRPDPNEMTDFNVLTLNAKIAPATEAIVARSGERVRIRIGNLSAMDHHPIHLHGHSFLVTETDGGTIPESARWPEVSVLVPVGSTRTIEFIAGPPGDWALHCHMTHHVMTQMGHGLPNLVGVDPSLFDAAIERAIPSFSEMGMGESGEHDTSIPKNSLPMLGMRGPFGYITMSGMFTVLQVRNELPQSGKPTWYEHPAEELARPATAAELSADGLA